MPRRDSLDSQRAQGTSSTYRNQPSPAPQDSDYTSRTRNQSQGVMSSTSDRFGRSSAHDAQHQQYQQRQDNPYADPLPPPTLPFVSSSSGNFGPGSRRDSSQSLAGSFTSKASRDSKPSNRKSGVLSTHYVPSKMSNLHQPGQYAHRRPAKRGGGMNAWDADGHGRMGGEDEDGDQGGRATGPVKDNTGKPKKLIWNRFKWVLFCANILFLAYSIAIMVVTLLVWFDIFENSDVLRVGNRTELIISTAAGALCLLTAMMGFSGILLNNRAFLGFYTLFLWFCLALIVAPGYITYKKKTFNLEGKINAQWSRDLGLDGRVRIQNQLHCCGYYSPFVEAVASNTCYPRSILPGCKSQYLKFERRAMKAWYIAAFALVPAQIGVIITALLCSNHVTYRLGKGIIPKQYRLDEASTAQLLNRYAADIAAQYPTLAQEALQRTSSSTALSEKYALGQTGHALNKTSRASSFSSLR